ncbi:hypothetical protein AB3X52_00380 [Nocardioides sp. DS6]|uniref:Secreted protein n=1 Tax=Nocardioides eburneus TaxID=3231482 RepID=A0ABV3SSZ2_9ACTN
MWRKKVGLWISVAMLVLLALVTLGLLLSRAWGGAVFCGLFTAFLSWTAARLRHQVRQRG